MKSAVTVGQLNRYVKSILSENQILNDIMVRGEISNFVRHYKSGHLYFTLKDDDAAVKAVMFRGNAQSLRFSPENGMAVIVTGAVTLYERDGSYQLYAQDIQPDGVGALYLAYEQLKEKLSREGLFDPSRKRPLPPYPETIGIVTSEGAAALQDMLHILGRRYPAAKILLCPAKVQGEGAAQTIIAGIRRLSETCCDLVIIGRGGGSMEDLWAFNNEELARAIAASPVPVISAVGHETDFTIADLAADLRAPTPSAAAELAVPNSADVFYYLDGLAQRCSKEMENILNSREQRLRELRARLNTPAGVLEGYSRRLDWARREVEIAMERELNQAAYRLRQGADRARSATVLRLERETGRLRGAARLLEASSPVRLLERGYSLTTSGKKTVTAVTDVAEGDTIATRVTDGTILSRVLNTEKNKKAVQGTPDWSENGKTDEP